MIPENDYTDPEDDFLSQYDDEYEGLKPEEERSFEDPPDDKYQVMVDKVEIKWTKKGDKQMLCWQLKILVGPYKNSRLFKNTVIGPKSLFFIRQDLGRCGVKLTKFSDLRNHLAQLLDLYLEVEQKLSKDGEYTNIYINKHINIGTNTGDEAPSDTKPSSNEFPEYDDVPF
ncbi:unnamed protein product [marine sediment metagenome]|uniref:DUF669 domain-containing protein n=1 Tax=marine sediment metagenome TaxID=412755 RepID=X0RX72_9ZZZZ